MVKVGPKVKTLGPSVFYENLGYFEKLLLFARVLSLVRILAILNHIWGVKTQKLSEKGYFMDAESARKTLKTFNLTIINAILMKLTTISYLHVCVN